MNDKFIERSLHWAKESFVPGAGWSNLPREEENIIISTSSNHNTSAASMDKSGSSGTAVKDTPGKDNFKPVTNFTLQGHEHARGGDQVREGLLGGGHGQQGVAAHLLPEGVPARAIGGGQVREGALGEGHGHQQGVAGHLLQEGHQCVAQEERDEQGEVDNVTSLPHFTRLRYPEESASPKIVRSRRKRKPDGLLQAKLNFVPTQKKQIIPSEGVSFDPSGGPQGVNKSERGFKRSLGDQVEGPARKKSRVVTRL
jgi:hypothetical protein